MNKLPRATAGAKTGGYWGDDDQRDAGQSNGFDFRRHRDDAVCGATAPAQSETLLAVDAREQPAAPETGYLRFGTNTAPSGSTIGINSRF